MRRPVKSAVFFVLPILAFCFAITADARSRCDEMRYRYLQAHKQIKTYTTGYKHLYADYKKHKASLGRLNKTIYDLQKQLVILKRNYPNEPKMWRGKQNRISQLKRGAQQNQKNLNITVQELHKYKRIVEKNRAIYNQNYKAWIEYGCKRQ